MANEKIILINSETGEKTEVKVDTRPKILRALSVFGKAFKKQATEEGTVAFSAISGLYNGLKYKGDLRRGVITAAVVDCAISAFNGITNVIKNWEEI